ncbi:MAG: SpoIIE family protein phosphatase [Crocinitomicaceae bacterium]|nr:SpoIIE family protein phosphatase [Crocinitomicaceae bacterium]
MSAKKALLLTIFTVVYLGVFAQSFYPPIVNYSSKVYGKDRNPENFCLVQDQRGIMYFGNSNGVLEYDGTSWKFIKTVPGKYVYSMAIDSSGTIYVGTYMDFGYLKPDSQGNLEYVSLLSSVPEDDQYFSTIWSICANKNEVFFQCDESVFVYDLASKEVKTVYPTEMSSFHTSFMVNGEYYVRAREIGIVKYVNGELERLKGTEVFRERGVFGLYELEDDSLLIVTQEEGLWKWKDDGIRRLPEVNSVPLSQIGIFGSARLKTGDVVLTTFSNGVYIIDVNGKIIYQINRNKGLRSNDVKNVFEDRDQNVWLGLGNGIAKVNYNSPLSYFDEKTGIDGNVQAIIRYKGKIYVGTSMGLFKQGISEDENREFGNTHAVKEQVWDFEIANDILYIATSAGVFRTTDGEHLEMLTIDPANVIKYDKAHNQFVVGGEYGIYVYGSDFIPEWSDNERSYSTFLSAEFDPNYANTLWMGTSNSGVFRLQLTPGHSKIDQYGFFDGLTDNQLTKPLLFQDSVIFGTMQGFLSFIHEDIMVKELDDSLKNDPEYYRGMFQTKALYDSIFTNTVLLLEDDKEWTWYCAEDKIGYYDKKEKVFRNKPFWGINYGRVNEFYLEDDGQLWIGCADGLIRYKKNKAKVYDSKFYSLIREVTIGRDSILFNGAFATNDIVQIDQSDNFIVELPYELNNVSFSFSAPYFEDEHVPEFSFYLEGYDDDWSYWGNKTEANFTNLPEGDYCFKVRARNIYGIVSEEASFKFSVSPPWYRTMWAYTLYGVVLIILFFIGFKVFSYRLKKKNIWLEGVVRERTREISEKNKVLAHQKQEIEDSINYAQRIQKAILPLEDEMKKWLPNSFVLFRPKDIVSGDFYWFTEKEGKLVFICADCTGHGVPGAFMSMIGSDRLNIIVGERQISNPGEILSELNVAIKKSLKQDGHSGSTRDGMDAAICTIDLQKKELRFAGANRPLWVVDGEEITEIKPTKEAVAGFTPDDQVYEEHVITLKEKMKFYMTSDGYADQFGGDKGKKLKVKAMKEFIMNVCNIDFQAQKEDLENHLVEWMGDHEQIDDVCVVGFEPLH